MANSISAEKRARANAKKRLYNTSAKSSYRKALKKALLAIENDSEDKDSLIKEAIKQTDMAASKGLIHKNKASRIKSKMSTK